MSTYCTLANIQSIFGTTNVAEWLDMDNDGSADSGRSDRAIAVASDEIDDVARAGMHYSIPLLTAAGATPTTISDLAATLAGLWLYESRGSQDIDPNSGKPYHRLAFKREGALRVLDEIRTGRRRIDAQ